MASESLSFLEILDPAWEKFITTQPEVNIFHHPAWVSLMAECYKFRPFLATLCDQNGKIQAGLPFAEIKNIYGRRRWISLPFTDYCPILYTHFDAQYSLYEQLSFLTSRPGTPEVEIRWDLLNDHPSNSIAPFYLTKIQLDPDKEKVFHQIHHSHQRNIRAASNNGIQIEFGASLEHTRQYYNLHVQTRHRQGIPTQPWRFFELIETMLFKRGLGFILLAYKEGDCLAGAVFLHLGKTMTYKYGASRVDGLALRPNHMIFWKAIQWGCENGFKLLDLGRTDAGNAGLREFKKRWGAEETPLRYISIPPQKGLGLSNRFLPLIKIIIKHSPVWFCRLSGNLLYKYSA